MEKDSKVWYRLRYLKTMHVFKYLNGQWQLSSIERSGIRSRVSTFGSESSLVFSGDGTKIFVGDEGANVQSYSSVGSVYVYANEVVTDSDGDGIDDEYDNCQDHVNPNQLDFDNDGLGDVCDSDDDNDGILDNSDNCQFSANPSQANLDDDRYGDVCDSDDDNDGMPDSWELNYGLNPKDASDKNQDLDGDGRTNFQEFEDRTDPTLHDITIDKKNVIAPILDLILD